MRPNSAAATLSAARLSGPCSTANPSARHSSPPNQRQPSSPRPDPLGPGLTSMTPCARSASVQSCETGDRPVPAESPGALHALTTTVYTNTLLLLIRARARARGSYYTSRASRRKPLISSTFQRLTPKCGKPVDNRWKSCGKLVDNFLGIDLSTGYPHSYPPVFHMSQSVRLAPQKGVHHERS
jgi:hypothetical protein